MMMKMLTVIKRLTVIIMPITTNDKDNIAVDNNESNSNDTVNYDNM